MNSPKTPRYNRLVLAAKKEKEVECQRTAAFERIWRTNPFSLYSCPKKTAA